MKDEIKKQYNHLKFKKSEKQTEKQITLKNMVLNQNSPHEHKTGLLDLLMVEKDNICESPKIKLPEIKDKLWVVRNIGDYVYK